MQSNLAPSRYVAVGMLLVSLAACGNASADSDQAAKAHDAAARANHARRLAWQKAHPAQYAAEKRAARAELALQEERRERRVAAEAAERQAEAKRSAVQAAYLAAHSGCRGFGSDLESLNVGAVVSKYDCSGIGSDGYLVHVTVVDDAWTQFSYDRRLQLAQGLWAMCVKGAKPKTADSCHVRLVGEAGEDLGGSNDFAGSMIDVSRD